MDIDYSKFEIEVNMDVYSHEFEYNVIMPDGDWLTSGRDYPTERAAIRGAKRAIKRIVETAVGDK